MTPLLRRRGHDIAYLDLPQSPRQDDTLRVAANDADLLVVLGGPIGVYETAAYPFLTGEMDAVASRIAAGRPTLGICLGAQIVAAALGALVYPGGEKEIGWSPVDLTPEGSSSVLAPLGSSGPGQAASRPAVLHWHGDTFDLPSGAALLASTPKYKNQAFSYPASLGDSKMPPVLALQFHLEVTPAALESWYVGHANEIAATVGISVSGLREQATEHGLIMAPMMDSIFDRWLDALCL